MAEFCYTKVPGKIGVLLRKIREVGVPPKVTVQWLKTIGFTSSNDPSLIGVLQQIDFIDQGKTPTKRWSDYRGANHKRVLGDAIRHGYADLFTVYPDAEKRPQADLDHVFSTTSSGGKQVITKTISTFKSLVELAEFSQSSEPGHAESVEAASGKQPASPPPGIVDDCARPSLHIDIQVHISPEASLEQIEKVFESMARHIYRAQTTDQ